LGRLAVACAVYVSGLLMVAAVLPHRADHAMDAAKRQGHGDLVVYQPDQIPPS
jgi:hypothetical protein